jgi:hypothetical protein
MYVFGRQQVIVFSQILVFSSFSDLQGALLVPRSGHKCGPGWNFQELGCAKTVLAAPVPETDGQILWKNTKGAVIDVFLVTNSTKKNLL